MLPSLGPLACGLLPDEEEAFTMTRCTKAIPAAVFGAALLLTFPAPSHAQSREPLSDRVKTAVEEALQDEYRGSEATYGSVLKAYGDLRPFSNVVRAERQHAAFLEDLLSARNLPLPKPREATVEAHGFASVKDACAAAVESETRNVALYDRLIAADSLPDEVRRAFEHNRMASRDHHKPAFERCAGAAAAEATGRGVGRGRGAGRAQCQAFGHCAGQACGACTSQACGSRGRDQGCGHYGRGRP
jgi:hypothetical protein